MKTPRLTTLLTVATGLLATVTTLSAESGENRPPRANREAFIERFDSNGDGQLDEAERQVARETIQARRDKMGGRRGPRVDWMQFDADGDGQLTGLEREAAAEHVRERITSSPRAMARLDTDGDGVLNDLEWADARAQWEQRMEERGAGRGKGRRAGGGSCQRAGE
jgi:hypothetical protein